MLFDLEPLGYIRYWDHLVRNNTLMSMLGVGYVQSPPGWAGAVEGMRVSAGPPELGDGMVDLSTYVLSGQGRRAENSLLLTREMAAGTYLFSLSARALEGYGASFRLEVFAEKDSGMRYASTPLNIYPGVIGRQFKRYYKVFHADGPGRVSLSATSPLFQAVEIRDISIAEIGGYGPLPMKGPGVVYQRAAGQDGDVIFRNNNALPRAYAVVRLRSAGDIYEVKEMFDLNRVDPAREAVVFEWDAPPPPQSGAYAVGPVEVKQDADRADVAEAAARQKPYLPHLPFSLNQYSTCGSCHS